MLASPIRSTVVVIGVSLALSGLTASANAAAGPGLPSVDRDWTGEDYALVAKEFATDGANLPRLSDKQGAALLRRLTSTENFAFHLEKSLPIQLRFPDFLKLQQSVNTMLMLYVGAQNKGENVHEELALMLAFTLRTAVIMRDLVNEFLPTVPKDDKYPVRMEGLKKVNSGMTTMFVGAERSLSERNVYSPDDLSLLLDTMASTLPKLKEAFPPGYIEELRGRLKADRPSFTAEKDRKNIDRMLKELGEPTDAAPPSPSP